MAEKKGLTMYQLKEGVVYSAEVNGRPVNRKFKMEDGALYNDAGGRESAVQNQAKEGGSWSGCSFIPKQTVFYVHVEEKPKLTKAKPKKKTAERVFNVTTIPKNTIVESQYGGQFMRDEDEIKRVARPVEKGAVVSKTEIELNAFFDNFLDLKTRYTEVAKVKEKVQV